MTLWQTVGVITEFLSWVGLGVGFIFLCLWAIARATDRTWRTADAALIEHSEQHHGPVEDALPRARWVDDHGSLYERTLTASEHHDLGRRESFSVYYSTRRPDKMRLDASGHGTKLFGLLALIFLSLGALAVISGLAILFLPR